MAQSVGYLQTEIQQDHPSDLMDEEQIQLSLDPKFQVYLAQMSRDSGCWTRFFPIPFERASQKSWWDPTFDSEILEEQYKKSAFPHNRFKFRYAICYTILASTILLAFSIYKTFVVHLQDLALFILFFVLLSYNLVFLLLTYQQALFQRHLLSISVIYSIVSVAYSLLILISTRKGQFCNCIQLLILIYTLIPLKLYLALSLAIIYSVLFEFGSSLFQETPVTVLTKILSHVAVHVIGLHIYLMSNVRMRQTFMKVGQSLLVRKQLELEKRLKENMIHSLMPPSVANWLLYENLETRRQSGDSVDLKSLFRPFNMDSMSDVSILFADIVGFTKMSSNKNADDLVEILNNLFQRFDDLCRKNNCEKISTLGDCYYCVSGCPKPQPDHATNCVEMGLSMIEAIKTFEREKREGINMRVGIHTGTVLCGIVGTKRFKFDVWSNDVTLANKMESTGKPGMVHVTEKTSLYLNGRYYLEEGESVSGLNTYFIVGRKPDNYRGSLRADGRQNYSNSLHLFVSPPGRPRVLSCDPTHLQKQQTQHQQNKNYLSPDSCIVKANSLPSILDSENEQDGGETAGTTKMAAERTDMKTTTPTPTPTSGKYKFKNWKIPKFIQQHRKTSSSKPDIDIDFVSNNSEECGAGYQQVPAIIESNGIKQKKDSVSTSTKYEEEPDSIDIKSYISHSRSDIGTFDFPTAHEFHRGGSYKSQFGRSLNGDFALLNRAGSNRSRRGRSPNRLVEGLEPLERARSATVTDGNLTRPHKRSLEVPSRLSSVAMLDEYSSHSRKDSGIRSNSRRSSLQIDNRLFNPETLQHRVSGYYTSSQSSMTSQQQPQQSIAHNQGPFFDKYGACIQNLRKQSDRQLIKCVQDNSKSQSSYFIKPPLSAWTLFFKDDVTEQEYRANVHRILPNVVDIDTLANSRFNTWVDVLVSIFVYLVVAVTLAMLYGANVVWLATFCVTFLTQILNLALCVLRFIRWLDKICRCLSRFYRWNLFGVILVSLPLTFAVTVISVNSGNGNENVKLEFYPLFLGLLHFCNFTQLNCWMKSAAATLILAAFVFAQTLEWALDSALVLILVWLLNREFEIGYRLSFHCNYVANRDKSRVQYLKNQADYLIYNIVPEHVAEQLKKDAKYSENFKDVAIIFASVVNFNEMYDESFEGGKEYLRVLNELIGDFDELLDKPEFDSVEKIKTIGSTFMAASGLNSLKRAQQADPNEHLFALVHFALAMQQVVEVFNRDLLEFNLIIRIGYNFGDVTAAVIGNTKLYYDVWGDAVNMASRMDSTGVNGRVQVGEHCLPVLRERFEFEHRGPVYVKGKDMVDVYLLKGPKTTE